MGVQGLQALGTGCPGGQGSYRTVVLLGMEWKIFNFERLGNGIFSWKD